MKSTGVKISSIAHFLPTSIVSNQEIIDTYSLRLKDQWVKDNIGIHTRHWCKNNETASDLGVEVLKQLTLPIDALLVSTVSQDFMTPATATVIQGKATPGKFYPAFDITAACSGFVYAIDTARRLVQTGKKNVACIATEVRSKYLNKQDRRTVMLFGDGAAGITLSPCEENEIGIIDSKTMADGRYYEAIVVDSQAPQQIEMKDATTIFQSAISEMKNLVNSILKDNDLKLEQIDYFIFHQASKVIVEQVANELGVPATKYFMNFPTKGNMTSASTAVALSEAVADKKIQQGDLVLMLATGGGFSAGTVLFRWEIP